MGNNLVLVFKQEHESSDPERNLVLPCNG